MIDITSIHNIVTLYFYCVFHHLMVLNNILSDSKKLVWCRTPNAGRSSVVRCMHVCRSMYACLSFDVRRQRYSLALLKCRSWLVRTPFLHAKNYALAA